MSLKIQVAYLTHLCMATYQVTHFLFVCFALQRCLHITYEEINSNRFIYFLLRILKASGQNTIYITRSIVVLIRIILLINAKFSEAVIFNYLLFSSKKSLKSMFYVLTLIWDAVNIFFLHHRCWKTRKWIEHACGGCLLSYSLRVPDSNATLPNWS